VSTSLAPTCEKEAIEQVLQIDLGSAFSIQSLQLGVLCVTEECTRGPHPFWKSGMPRSRADD
jgi:hypothetical protein